MSQVIKVPSIGIAKAQNRFSPNYLSHTADMSVATYKTAATHEMFTVTGLVRVQLLVECTKTLVDAADGASIQFGYEGATNGFIGSTGAAGAGGNTIAAGELWIDNSPADTVVAASTAIFDYIIPNGLDIGYEITGAALTDGTLVFHCWWEPISPTGLVIVGPGTAL